MIDKIISLKNHQGFMKYFKNTSWLFFEKILRMLVGLFVGIWVTRYLGPERFGLFSYAQSFVGLFAAIATLGLDGIVVREIVKDESKATELIGTAFYLKLMGAVVTLLVLVIATQFTSNNRYTNLLVFIIASATIFQSFNVVDMYFQSKVLSKYAVFSNIISLFISSIVKITLILINAPLVAFAWAILFDSVVLAMGFIYFFLKYSTCEIKKIKFNKTIAISLLKDSWPLILSGVVISIYMKIDQVMIQEILGNEAVGQYAAATRLSEIWYFIPTILVSSLFPAVVNARKQSEELYYSRLQKLFDLVVWIAIIIALPMTFLSDMIVDILYGKQYSQSASVLMIHIWAFLPVCFGVVLGQFYIVENLNFDNLIRNLIGVFLNIILNCVFICNYGIKGAAYASLISFIYISMIHALIRNHSRRNFKCMIKSLMPLKTN